jgi:glutathione synthase/RimK-type ligase-like ATP-grasp enzyme
MNILVIAEKKAATKPIIEAIREKGAHAKYLRISKIMLVTNKNETLIKALGMEIPRYDAVFLQARTSLAPFVEPLLDEIEKIGSYANTKKGSYYLASNEPYLFIALAHANIPTPKTISTASKQILEKDSKKISYPVLVKTFSGKKEQQALIMHNQTQLNYFIKSIKTEIDAFLVREYLEGELISCAKIGKRIFAVKRIEDTKGNIPQIKKGQTYRLTETEEKSVNNAAETIGYDTARIDLVKGKIIKIDPIIPLHEFNEVCSMNLEEEMARHLIKKAEEYADRVKRKYTLIEIAKKMIEPFLEIIKKLLETVFKKKNFSGETKK